MIEQQIEGLKRDVLKMGGMVEHAGSPSSRRLPMKAGIGSASLMAHAAL